MAGLILSLCGIFTHPHVCCLFPVSCCIRIGLGLGHTQHLPPTFLLLALLRPSVLTLTQPMMRCESTYGIGRESRVWEAGDALPVFLRHILTGSPADICNARREAANLCLGTATNVCLTHTQDLLRHRLTSGLEISHAAS